MADNTDPPKGFTRVVSAIKKKFPAFSQSPENSNLEQCNLEQCNSEKKLFLTCMQEHHDNLYNCKNAFLQFKKCYFKEK